MARSTPSTAGQFLNSRDRVLLTGINDMVRAEAVSHFQTTRARPHQDDPGSPELLAGLDGHEAHRARAKDGNVVPRNIAAGRVEAIQTRPSGGNQHRILERHLRRHFVERADMVQHIFRKPAISGHAGGAMALLGIAIVQAGGIFANETVITPAAAVMRFNTDPVTHGEFIDGLPQGHHSPRPLVPGRKGAIGQGERKMPVVDLEIAAAGPTHSHFHQDLARTGLRHGAIDHANVPRAKEYSRTHCLRNGVLLYAQ